MIFALGEIWLSLLLALLLGFFLAWLLWKWRRHTVSRTEWADLNGELSARRRSLATLEHEHSVLLANRNAAEAQHVRMQATIDDLQARADLLPVMEARLQQSESRQAQPTRSFPQGNTGVSQDVQAEARRAAATATGAVPPVPPDGSVASDSASTDSAARDTAARDTAARETAARDTAARETAARETAARDAAARDRAAIDSANERANELAAQLDASTTAVNELEAERQQLTAESEERHRRVRQLEEELLTANARAARAQETADQAKREATDAKAATRQALSSVPPLTPPAEQEAEARQRASEAQQAQDQLDSARREVADTTARLERAETSLAAMQGDLDAAQAELAARNEQTANLQLELRRRGGELERRVIEQNRLSTESEQLQADAAEATSQRTAALEQLATRTTERDTALSARDAATEQLAIRTSERDAALTERNALAIYPEQVEALRLENQTAATRTDDLTHELDGVAQELDSAHERIAELSAEVEVARQRMDEANEREAAIAAQAQDQRAADATEVTAQRQQIAALEQSLLETRDQSTAMRDRLLQANQRAEELGRNQMRLKALEARVAHLSASEAELLQLRGRQPGLERRAARAEALEADIAEQRQGAAELAARLEDAQQRALRVVELEGKLRASDLEREQLRTAMKRAQEQPETPNPVPSSGATEQQAAEVAELQQRARLVPQLETRISDLERDLAESRESSRLKATDGQQTEPEPGSAAKREKKNSAAKADAKAASKEIDALKKSLSKSERSLKDSRHELRKLQKAEAAKLSELEGSLKHLRRDADQNSATIAALRHDLVKARSAKAGHREKRLRSAEAKVAQLEAASSKRRSKADRSTSKSAEKPADDLKLINGIGPRLERTLNNFGITRFEQLAAMKSADIDKLQKKLPRFPGRIVRDNWVGQAKSLVKKAT